MEFAIKSLNPEKLRTACAVIGVFESRQLSGAAQSLDKQSKGLLAGLMKRGDIEGKLCQTLLLHHIPNSLCERILLVGCGPSAEFGEAQYRKVVNKALQILKETPAQEAAFHLLELDVPGRDLYWKTRQAVEITRGAIYRFDQLKSRKNGKPYALSTLTFNIAQRADVSAGERAVREGVAIADGMDLAKNLGDLPGNICTPSYIAKQAKSLQKDQPKIKVNVLDEAAMEKLGMGSLLAVARGSHEPAKFITLEYQGGKKGDKPIVLVGKGVTFDTGGISIKPAATMDEMKYDMSGAASVLGALSACAQLQLPLNVVGVIPSTENMPGGSAIKPGDIVTSMSGQTIEILNTDAEGRLILCDALTYSERYNPDVVIDIATLTGACVVALGKVACGLLGNSPPLIQDLLKAGETSGDRAWEMPLWDDYQDHLKTNFADMANIGGRDAGTITAACFLSRFTKKFRWAHLDVAGTAWNSGEQKGSTGRPVPLLMQYLIDRSAKAKIVTPGTPKKAGRVKA
ncbi:MAG: leucyl aminopeptidase [Gammaproteobacteria bacterium]